MVISKKNKSKEFFESYSKNVDNASLQFFWKLCDEIILTLLRMHIVKSKTSRKTVILDAGGGTGRWVEILSRIYHSKFILIDNSIDMLKVARNKDKLKGLGTRLQIIEGDIQKMDRIKDSSVDYVISLYNPLSFLNSPLLFFREIKRILESKGYGLVMAQGFPNAIASKINNYFANSAELKKLVKYEEVKWNKFLAPLKVFSKESLEAFAVQVGLETIKTYGVPIFVQPGPEDFDPENKLRSKISSKLESDQSFYKTVYHLEMKYNSLATMVNRGMNLMIVVHKK